MRKTLIFGGARSGKSAYAEQLAESSGKAVLYVATARGDDHEMTRRIRHHRERRNAAWTTMEEPTGLGELLLRHSAPDTLLLVDCLTLWLSNLLFSEGKALPDSGEIPPPASFVRERAAFLSALEQCPGEVVLVSNEVGMGIVPMGAVSRWFVDEAGRLNQAVTARSDSVIWVAAGLPLRLKG